MRTILVLVLLHPLALQASPVTTWRRAVTLAKLGETRTALQSLTTLAGSSGWRRLSPVQRRRATVLRARLALESGQPAVTLKLLKGLRSPHRAVRSYLRYYRGLAALALKRYRAASRDFTKLLAEDDSFLYWRRASVLLARCLERSRQRRRAQKLYARLARRLGDRYVDKPLVLYRLAQLRGGDKRLLRRLAIEFGHTRHGALALAKLRYRSLSKAERLRRARQLMKRWRYDLAERELQQLVKQGAPIIARYWLGIIYQRKLRTRFAEGIRQLQRVYRDGGKLRGDALFRIAKSYAKLERYDQALTYYRRYIKAFPKGRHIEDAYYYLGWLPHDRHQDVQAIQGFDEYLAHSPRRSRKLTYVLWFRAWSLFRLKAYARAIVALRKLVPIKNTLVGGKALYWIGRSHEQLGQRQQAIAVYRQLMSAYALSYYPFLAHQRLLALGQPSTLDWLAQPPQWPRSRRDAAWPVRALSRKLRSALAPIRALVEIGEMDAARNAYEVIADRVERELARRGKLVAFFQLNASLERFHQLWRWAGRRHGHALNGYPKGQRALLYAMAYPRAYRDYARFHTKTRGIPEYVVYAIMRQESRYRVSAISHTDAMGLMQVIPKTAKKIGAALGRTYSQRTFFLPRVNLRYSSYYLAELVKKFKGQFIFAFAGYNAGAHAMARFLDLHKGLPFDAMVEEIAYNEARNYCRKVAEHYLRYLYLYEPPERRRTHLLRLFPARVSYDYLNNINY